ncbi:T9SS type A sorting domain-containing protein [candidate division KSB1 bacterium]|nr:T9SS type A sorting domain-containing protein [candidate division KSB1 bacterium]
MPGFIYTKIKTFILSGPKHKVIPHTVLLLLTTTATLHAQLPKASDYFPLAVGNIWQYQPPENIGQFSYFKEIINDTLVGDSLLIYKFKKGGYYNYNNDSTIVYVHSNFPQNPFNGFPLIDTRDGLEGRWEWLFGDFIGVLAITDTGTVFRYDELRHWADVNTIIPIGDSIRIDNFWTTTFLTGIGMTKFGNDTVRYAKINGKEFGTLVSVSENEQNSQNKPDVFQLYIYPNPIKGNTNILIEGKFSSSVEIRIFDLLGRTVKTFIDQQPFQVRRTLLWDGSSDQGRHVPSGIYFIAVKSKNNIQTKKIIYLGNGG